MRVYIHHEQRVQIHELRVQIHVSKNHLEVLVASWKIKRKARVEIQNCEFTSTMSWEFKFRSYEFRSYSFLMKPFSYHDHNNQEKKLNIKERKEILTWNKKYFLSIFKGLSLKELKSTFWEGDCSTSRKKTSSCLESKKLE